MIESLFADATPRTSRDVQRQDIVPASNPRIATTGVMYVVKDTRLHSDSDPDSVVLGDLERSSEVAVTGEVTDGWTQIEHNGLPRWIRTGHLSTEPPKLAPHEGAASSEPCYLGAGPERGLRPDTVRVYRAVCARFPEITRYGGVAGRGEHATGHALDIMVSGQLGRDVAAFLQAHRVELGISYLIYEQKIWTVQRGGEGWRRMKSRGGKTANHYDHVHVTTYGSAGTA